MTRLQQERRETSATTLDQIADVNASAPTHPACAEPSVGPTWAVVEMVPLIFS